MFPSSNNTNNYLHPTYFNQSSSSSSPSSTDSNLFLQHYHCHPFPPGQFLLACIPETTPTIAASPNLVPTTLVPKKQVKKDRHSKIYTSHGLRDRRVRLSIGIARQFFDLQELLGFDKASNTIEWLLTKSRKSIRKVVESKARSTGGPANASPAGSVYEMVSESDEETEEGSDHEGLVSKDKFRSLIQCSGERTRESQEAARNVQVLAEESRAKARTRAKERTREKIYTRKITELKDSPEPILNEARSSTGGFGSFGKLKEITHENDIVISNSSRNDTIEESIVISRKIRQASSMNYQQALMLSKDLNSNSYLSCIPQNWDVNGATIYPTFATHSVMNSLADDQSHQKPWETHNNGHDLEQ